ncbi:MAG: DUF6438 domain-containing protein [Gammaproteobacteria bacterium]|nr:hypothetical protein [Pseudomonadales bacterium]
MKIGQHNRDTETLRRPTTRTIVVLLLALTTCHTEPSEVTSISLQRTACFGICPVYAVTIYSDGLVEFHGERFVESAGDFQYRIEQEDFASLAAFAEQIDFFSLDTEYRYKTGPNGERIAVSDLPSRITTVEKAGESKTVLNYFGGPEALTAFENLIDQLARTADRIGSTAPSL